MRPLSESTARVAKSNFSRKYIALGRIVNAWRDIAGADLAEYAQPVKVNYRKKMASGNKKGICTLEVACNSAHATTIHYQKGLILQRIANVFGEGWITDIKFVPSVCAPKKRLRRTRRTKPLKARDKAHLTKSLAFIEDDAIKQRLESLGQHILMETTS